MRRSLTSVLILILSLCVAPRVAVAQAVDDEQVAVLSAGELPESSSPANAVAQAAGTPRTVAITYSDAYELRRKIHVYASLTTVPLFVAQSVIGARIYDGDASGSLRSAHSAVAAGIGALFAVNTVTGGWNLWEARKDPNGRKRRLIHGISMMGADVGFLATAMMTPDDDDEGGGSRRALHRNLAITSVGIASASYLYMLLTR